jgi:glycosyltransferase involved in cell wall biosynthesis
MEELVSVIIPAYNRASTIIRAIDSVLNQTYKIFEIIIVDDGSLDNTKQLVESIKDKRMVYIKHPRNEGGAAARNTGIKVAKGQYIAFLDSDDEWLPEKIEKQLNLFRKLDNSFGVVYTGFYVIKKNKIIKEFTPRKKMYVLNDLLMSNCIGTLSSVMVRVEYLNIIRGFDETFKSCQDWDLYIRLSKLCKFDFITGCLVKYHETDDSFRISNKRQAIVSGHEKIFEKYNNEINNLPIELKALFFNYLGRKYLETGELKLALCKIFKAFIVSNNYIYLLKIFKGILLFVLFKIRKI